MQPPEAISAPANPPMDVGKLIDAAVERAMEKLLASLARLIDGRLEDRLLPALDSG